MDPQEIVNFVFPQESPESKIKLNYRYFLGIRHIHLSVCYLSDVSLCIVVSYTWRKLKPTGHAPSSRTAHAAARVGKRIFIHGGMSSVGTALDDVYSLDTGWCNW